jgi:hypothetical protein
MTLLLITGSILHILTLKATFAQFLQEQPTGEIVLNNPYLHLFQFLFFHHFAFGVVFIMNSDESAYIAIIYKLLDQYKGV